MTDAPPPTSWYERYLRGEPIDLKGCTGLLLDSALVEDRWNVFRSFNPPLKYWKNPVVVMDKPWEPGGPSRPSVLWDPDEGVFRMWYTIHSGLWFPAGHAAPGTQPENWQSKVVAYAESEDGVNWRKPSVRSYLGYPDTNVVFQGEYKITHSMRVSLNHPSTGQPGKFLMSYADTHPQFGRSLFLAHSDDGINWRRDPANPVLWPVEDTRHNLTYDETTERWLLYTRPVAYAGSGSIGRS